MYSSEALPAFSSSKHTGSFPNIYSKHLPFCGPDYDQLNQNQFVTILLRMIIGGQ